MATKQYGLNDQRAAQSELDFLQRQLDRLTPGTSDYIAKQSEVARAKKRVDDIDAALTAERSTKKTAQKKRNVAKQIKDLQGPLALAKKRGDQAIVEKLTAQIQALGGSVEPTVGQPTPTEAQRPALAQTTATTPTTKTKKAAAPAAASTSTGTGISSELKKAGKIAKGAEKKPMTIDEIYNKAVQDYGAIDLIFKQDSELKDILTKAVNQGWTPQRFVNTVSNTNWFKSKAPDLQKREFQKRQYRDLINQGGNKEDLYKNTEYGRGLANTLAMVKDAAVAYGAALSDADAELLAQDLYDSANEDNAATIKQLVRAKITYTPGAALGGAAGESLRDLEKTAAANGLDLNRQFGSSIQGWLQKINQGESVETYKQIIRDTAKIGLPERVASLIDKGIDLETIYNPYKQMMAATLEVNPETIKLNDPTLRMGIGPDKEMSLYDYQRALRKDSRWQYTDNARQEVSTIAQNVLRDFGFQG